MRGLKIEDAEKPQLLWDIRGKRTRSKSGREQGLRAGRLRRQDGGEGRKKGM